MAKWNFRKSFKIAPGVRMTLGKKGASISAGPKGYKVSVNSKGDVHRTVSIPGTGLYKRDKISGVTKQSVNKKKINLFTTLSILSFLAFCIAYSHDAVVFYVLFLVLAVVFYFAGR